MPFLIWLPQLLDQRFKFTLLYLLVVRSNLGLQDGLGCHSWCCRTGAAHTHTEEPAAFSKQSIKKCNLRLGSVGPTWQGILSTTRTTIYLGGQETYTLSYRLEQTIPPTPKNSQALHLQAASCWPGKCSTGAHCFFHLTFKSCHLIQWKQGLTHE